MATIPANNNSGLYGVNGTLIPVDGNITANVITANTVNVSGTVTANTVIGNTMSASGNVSTSGYFIGDGSQLTNIPSGVGGVTSIVAGNNITISPLNGTGNVTINAAASSNYGNANVAAYLPTYTGNLNNVAAVPGSAITGSVANATYAVTAGSATTATTATSATTAVSSTTAGTVTTAAQPNITGVGMLSTLSVNGNVRGGNILTAGQVSATGNVTGAYIKGDGSQLTNLPSGVGGVTSIVAGNNITISPINGTGNVTINAAGGNYGNANVAAYLPTYSGNLSPGNLLVTSNANFNNTVVNGVATPIVGTDAANKTYVDNATAAGGFDITDGVSTEAIDTGDTIEFAGDTNITVLVDTVSGTSSSVSVSLNDNISVVGNVTGAYILGDGSQLTNLPIQPGTYNDSNVAAYLPTYTGNLTAGNISATGNVTGAYILGDGSQLTGLPATYGNADVAAYLPTYSGNLNSVSAVPGAAITGTVGNATYATTAGSATTATTANTVTYYSQPNIQEVGNLYGLTVGGLTTVNQLSGGSTNLSALTVGNTINAVALSATGNVTGAYIKGDGSMLTNILATSLATVSK